MNRIISNWENDLIDTPEEIVSKFVSEKYPKYDFKLLSGLRNRDISDLHSSLEESRVVIMQPSLLQKEQIAKIVQSISHQIHINNNGTMRIWDIRDFVFLSSQPFEDLKTVQEACVGIKDAHNEYSLSKILYNCECHFYGFAGEHYELKKSSPPNDTFAIRHK